MEFENEKQAKKALEKDGMEVGAVERGDAQMMGRTLGVKELQDKLYGHRYAATTLDGNPDFVALCAAYGLPAKRAESNRQAVEIAKEMLEHKGPFVLVCRVDPDTPTI